MFDSDILNHAVLAVGIILICVNTSALYNSTLRHRILPRKLLADLGPIRPGAFVLVYFSTTSCVVCKTIQRPAIESLSGLLDDSLQVFEIDALKEPKLARRWGVLSVPATFLINPHGELHYVNHGVARAEDLLIQLHH
jgi:hypothetical protein